MTRTDADRIEAEQSGTEGVPIMPDTGGPLQPDHFLNQKDAAARLGITPRWFRAMVASGDLPRGYPLGRTAKARRWYWPELVEAVRSLREPGS